MRVHHVLLFCCLAALCEGNMGPVSTRLNIFTGAEGGSGSVHCHFSPSGSSKFFCKEQCEEGDVLVKTDDVTSQRGRYSVAYKHKPSGKDVLSVTISNLTKSDSGRYRCGLGSSSVPDSYSDFEIRVSHLLDTTAGFILTSVEGETYRKPCFAAGKRSRSFFCKGDCETEDDVLVDTEQTSSRTGRYGIEHTQGSAARLYVTIERVTKSDAGQYKCGYGRALSPDSSYSFSVFVIDAPTTSSPNWTLQPFSTPAFKVMTRSPSGSERDSVSPVSSETTDQPAAAVPTTSAPKQTPQPRPVSVLSQGLSSVPGSSSPVSVFPGPAAAALSSSKPKRTFLPPLTPGPPVSSAATQMFSSSSGSSTPSGFPETSTQPPSAASVTSQPNGTLRPLTSVLSESGSSTPPASPETPALPAAAASTIFKPKRNLRPWPVSVPSASSATSSQSLSFITASEAATTEHLTAAWDVPRPSNFLPLFVCLPLAAVMLLLLLLAASLLLRRWKRKKQTNQKL